MPILPSIEALPADRPLAVTVGVFDGLHRGHLDVLRTAAEAARERDAASTVITFEPHPAAVLRGAAPCLLTDPAERLERIAAAGIDLVVLQRFDLAFSKQSAEAFVERIAAGRDLRALVMSPESAFGKDRAGTIDAMRRLAGERSFDVIECAERDSGGSRISSGRIRSLVGEGRLATAARLLGRRYAVVGTVVRGDQRGRTLGYPTANFAFDEPVCLPPDGIYAVRIGWGGGSVLVPTYRADGVASLGVRPTFGVGARVLEVHLFDFDGDLYGRRMRVEFVRRQRGERRFAGVDELVRQMDLDCIRARAILAAAPRVLPRNRTPDRLPRS
ncbi:MAG: bifunctional riboflavin kinase/FAD synthetase [Chloroflexi bacterium]|nr:bifunctional riboflavin kinase/FAD synthetase [Chloroflexota bacterium]